MEKKYVVYRVFSYTDDNFCLVKYKEKDSEYNTQEEAINRVNEIRNTGYNVEIVEMWGKQNVWKNYVLKSKEWRR